MKRRAEMENKDNKEKMVNAETAENVENAENTEVKEAKKSKKGKIIGIVVAAVVVIAGVLVWYSGAIGGISEAEARSIAYQQVAGASDDGSAIVTEDFDDMTKTYDVQFTYNDMLYEFEILARNGKVLNQESERIGAVQQPSQITQPSQSGTQGQSGSQANDIGMDKAIEIAVQNVEGATDEDVIKIAFDNENGMMIYEVEIIYNNMEYDFDIDAATGNIVGQSSESVYN